MASRIAKTPLVQIQRQFAAQASPALKKSTPSSDAIEVSSQNSETKVHNCYSKYYYQSWQHYIIYTNFRS